MRSKAPIRNNQFGMLLLTVLVAALHSLPASAESAINVGDTFDHARLSPFFSYYTDERGDLQYADITALPPKAWQHSHETITTFGYTQAVYWFRFSVASDRERPLLLSVANAGFDSLTLYSEQDGNLVKTATGREVPLAERPVRHRHHLLPLTGQSPQTTYYLQARTSGAFNLPLTLWSTDAFHKANSHDVVLNGIYFGVLLVVIIYNLVAMSVVKRAALAGFVGFSTAFGLHQFAATGLAFETFWGRYPGLLEVVPVLSLGIAVVSVCWLITELLDLKSTSPLGHRWLQVVGLAAAGCMTGYVLVPFHSVMPVLSAVLVLTALSVFTLGLRQAATGYRVGLYATIAWTPLMFGIVAKAATDFDLMPASFITDAATPTGFILMILSLSFIIAAELRRTASTTPLLGLQAIPAGAHHPAQNTENLEGMVAERTSELENALKELSQAHEILKEINTIDSVTGIKNRHYFETIFEQEWKRASREKYPVSLMIIDIDLFKKVNDTYGHLAGDECLREVAHTIGAVLRRPADILARYGGEEFVVVLPYIENENALYLAEQIRKRVEGQLMHADGHELHVTISVGVSTVTPVDLDERKDLVSAADIALYEAKNTGRNKVCNAGQLTVHTSSAAS